MALNPRTCSARRAPPRHHREDRSPSCARTAETKLQARALAAPGDHSIQQKFSIPVACFVFAIIGLALGLTVARDGKLGGFVVGIVVIFAYYVVMFLAEAQTKGHYRASRRRGASSRPAS